MSRTQQPIRARQISHVTTLNQSYHLANQLYNTQVINFLNIACYDWLLECHVVLSVCEFALYVLHANLLGVESCTE